MRDDGMENAVTSYDRSTRDDFDTCSAQICESNAFSEENPGLEQSYGLGMRRAERRGYGTVNCRFEWAWP